MFTSEHTVAADAIFNDLLRREGLYATVNFGFRRTKYEQRKIDRLWAKAKKLAVKGKYNA